MYHHVMLEILDQHSLRLRLPCCAITYNKHLIIITKRLVIIHHESGECAMNTVHCPALVVMQQPCSPQNMSVKHSTQAGSQHREMVDVTRHLIARQ